MNPSSPFETEIDATLRLLGRVEPPAGLNDRVTRRLTNVPGRAARRGPWHWPAGLRMAVGGLAASLCASAIVLGTVAHSRHIGVVAPPVRVGAPGGFGAAGAEHMATKPVAPANALSGRNVRHVRHGRAVVAPDAHKAPGVAVPQPPEQ